MNELTDFLRILTDFNNAKERYLDNTTEAKARQKALNDIPQSFRTLDFLEQIVTYLGHMPIVYNEQGKISATGIIEALGTSNMVYALQYVYIVNRGVFYKTSGKIQYKESTLGGLTPIGMYALKRDKDAKYEDWDKEDPMLRRFLGKYLTPLIGLETKEVNMEVITSIRDYYIVYANGNRSLNSFPNRGIMDIGEKRFTTLESIMYAQMWLANGGNRNTESMILDPVNWDNIPNIIDTQVGSAKPISNTPNMLDW